MTDRSEIDKLRMLIPHWIDHNNEHAEEFRSWSNKAGDASAEIEAAAAHMEAVNDALQKAVLQLGGPLEFEHDHTGS
jgi:hypothetical protein